MCSCWTRQPARQGLHNWHFGRTTCIRCLGTFPDRADLCPYRDCRAVPHADAVQVTVFRDHPITVLDDGPVSAASAASRQPVTIGGTARSLGASSVSVDRSAGHRANDVSNIALEIIRVVVIATRAAGKVSTVAGIAGRGDRVEWVVDPGPTQCASALLDPRLVDLACAASHRKGQCCRGQRDHRLAHRSTCSPQSLDSHLCPSRVREVLVVSTVLEPPVGPGAAWMALANTGRDINGRRERGRTWSYIFLLCRGGAGL